MYKRQVVGQIDGGGHERRAYALALPVVADGYTQIAGVAAARSGGVGVQREVADDFTVNDGYQWVCALSLIHILGR